MKLSTDELQAVSLAAREDLLAFTALMFWRRRGFTWKEAPHHWVICDALMRVFRGEITRLIINIPPRYSKTELAVVNFIAWSLGKVPDAEFIHVSYGAAVAVQNAANVRSLMEGDGYRAVFPEVQLANDSRAHLKTSKDGALYATGAGGPLTGMGAGKDREGFGGCFPVGTNVWTNRGLLPIDRIVRERMNVSAWAFDYAGRMVLRPITAWHENAPNDIVRVSFDDGASVECTPDHRFWTLDRGWVRADSLRVDDRLPCVHGCVERTHDIGINAESIGSGLDPMPVLAAGPAAPVELRDVGLLSGQDRAHVGLSATLLGGVAAAGNGLPRIAAPDLLHHGGGHAAPVGNGLCRLSDGVVDGQRLLVGQDGGGVNLGLAEVPVPLAVNDVRRPGVVAQVVEAVVTRVPVGMADVGASRSAANEGDHDQRVDARVLDSRVFGEADPEVSAVHPCGLEQDALLHVSMARSSVRDFARLTLDAPDVADRVEPFVSGHRSPLLVQRIRHDDVTFCLTVDEYHNFTVESGLVVKNCIVIDDPHKADEALSDLMRRGVIDWYQNTLESRQNAPGRTPIILIMQRLHQQDLAGWLMAGGSGEEWTLISLPAIQPDGSALWPHKHSIEMLRIMEQAKPYTFGGQYQQRPSPAEGGIFKPGMLETIDALPAGPIQWVRGWDFADSTKGDFTAGGKLGKLTDGRFVIGHMERERFTTDKRDTLVKNTASRDGQIVRISIPQDPGQAGKGQVLAMTRMLAGKSVHSSPESGDKVTRAETFASQVNVGNVLMLRGAWNDPLTEEMRLFPNGTYDDQVDALSRAFEALMGGHGATQMFDVPL